MTTLETAKGLQEALKSKGFYKGKIDGLFGPQSKKSLAEFVKDRASKVTFRHGEVPEGRLRVAAIQLILKESGIDSGIADGFMGPQTLWALDAWDYRLKHGSLPIIRDPEGLLTKEGVEGREPMQEVGEPTQKKPVRWPLQKDVEKFYGPKGANQAMLEVPYVHRLAWNLNAKVSRFSCHEKVHDPIKRVLTRVLDHYGEKQINLLRLDRFGGCLNVRRMRGGTSWSMHSWGIALDYDPENNQLKQDHKTATFANAPYAMWFRLWEEEGFVSLGRERDYDWMHVQAARLS